MSQPCPRLCIDDLCHGNPDYTICGGSYCPSCRGPVCEPGDCDECRGDEFDLDEEDYSE